MKKLYEAVDSALMELQSIPFTGIPAIDLFVPHDGLFKAMQATRDDPVDAVIRARSACEALVDCATLCDHSGRENLAAVADDLRRINRELSPVVADCIGAARALGWLAADGSPVAD